MVTSTNNSKLSSGELHSQNVSGTNSTNSETTKLISALHQGWQLHEVSNYLAHGLNAEGAGYLITLFNPHERIIREWSVSKSPEIDYLLKSERISI